MLLACQDADTKGEILNKAASTIAQLKADETQNTLVRNSLSDQLGQSRREVESLKAQLAGLRS